VSGRADSGLVLALRVAAATAVGGMLGWGALAARTDVQWPRMAVVVVLLTLTGALVTATLAPAAEPEPHLWADGGPPRPQGDLRRPQGDLRRPEGNRQRPEQPVEPAGSTWHDWDSATGGATGGSGGPQATRWSARPGPAPAPRPGPAPASAPRPGPASEPAPRPGPASRPGPTPRPGPASRPGPGPAPATTPAAAAEPGPEPATVALPVRPGAWWEQAAARPVPAHPDTSAAPAPAYPAARPDPARPDPARPDPAQPDPGRPRPAGAGGSRDGGNGDGDGPAASRVVQCPRCGDFGVDVRQGRAGFAFTCLACGNQWQWQPGHSWPVAVVRPRERHRPDRGEASGRP
jgi:hypothetical protein